MRPSQYVFLDALPRTVQGKIDVWRCPRRRHSRPEPETPPEANENALAALWRDAGPDALPDDTTTFSLGGTRYRHSTGDRINEDLGALSSPTCSTRPLPPPQRHGSPRP